jgi:hypothetical protein
VTALQTSTKTRASTKAKRAPAVSHALVSALMLAQHDGRTVAKRGRNDDHDYAYALAEDVIEEAKCILERHGLALIPAGTKLRRDDAGAPIMAMRWTLVHPSSGQERDLGEWEWPVTVEAFRPLDRAWASADTACLAYFLRDLLQLKRTEPEIGLDDGARMVSSDVFARAAAGGPPSVTARGRPGGGVRRDSERAVLMIAVKAELDRLGVAEEERDEKCIRVLGRATSTTQDVKELLAKLRKTKR